MNPPTENNGEHYNLRWNSYTNNLIKVIVEHQQFETLVDVTLACGRHFIKAHKLVLSACSGYFREIFKIHESPHPFLIFNGINFKHLKQIVEFMYCGEIKVLDVDLPGVLELGETFQVKGLSMIKVKSNNEKEKDDDCQIVDKRPEVIEVNDCEEIINCNNEQPPKKRIKSVKTGGSPQFPGSMKDLLDKNSINSVTKEVDQKQDNVSSSTQPQQQQTTKNVRIEKIPCDSAESTSIYAVDVAKKIPRPPNAFMLFANVWRKKLAAQYPSESNKSISIRLGSMWRTLAMEEKDEFYAEAKKANAEHKIKYPGYYYSPAEARIRKAATGLLKKRQLQTMKLVKIVMNEGASEENTSGIEFDETDDDMQLNIDEESSDNLVIVE